MRHAALQPQRTHHRGVGEIHHGPPSVVEQIGRRTSTGGDQDGLVGSQATDRRFVGAPDDDRRCRRRVCRAYRRSSRPIHRRSAAGREAAVHPEYPAADRVWCAPIRTRAPAAGWRRSPRSTAPRPGSAPDATYRPLARTALRIPDPSRSVRDPAPPAAAAKQRSRIPAKRRRPAHTPAPTTPCVRAAAR